jgi:hypothetical protein
MLYRPMTLTLRRFASGLIVDCKQLDEAGLAMLMLMPAAAASIPAVKSAQCPPGHIVSGGYCTPMFRRAPGLPGPPFPGNGISIPALLNRPVAS